MIIHLSKRLRALIGVIHSFDQLPILPSECDVVSLDGENPDGDKIGTARNLQYQLVDLVRGIYVTSDLTVREETKNWNFDICLSPCEGDDIEVWATAE